MAMDEITLKITEGNIVGVSCYKQKQDNHLGKQGDQMAVLTISKNGFIEKHFLPFSVLKKIEPSIPFDSKSASQVLGWRKVQLKTVFSAL